MTENSKSNKKFLLKNVKLNLSDIHNISVQNDFKIN